ncbi:MAG TPA: hypothetical protein VMC06_09855 [Opitutaceae bacterium]|nr:hypothetical protein [Opitutaceae bacterium]
MKKFLHLLAAAVLLAGCATSNPSARSGGPYVKPGLIMVTPDQAANYGLAGRPAEATPPAGVPPLATSAVLAAPGVRVYTFGRMQDAADQDLLHETHVAYRRETAPRWQMQAPADQQILVGPRITDSRQDFAPIKDREVEAYLAEQHARQQEDRKAIELLFKGLDTLTKQQVQQMKMLGALAKVQQDAAKESNKDITRSIGDREGDKTKPAGEDAHGQEDKDGGPQS